VGHVCEFKHHGNFSFSSLGSEGVKSEKTVKTDSFYLCLMAHGKATAQMNLL